MSSTPHAPVNGRCPRCGRADDGHQVFCPTCWLRLREGTTGLEDRALQREEAWLLANPALASRWRDRLEGISGSPLVPGTDGRPAPPPMPGAPPFAGAPPYGPPPPMDPYGPPPMAPYGGPPPVAPYGPPPFDPYGPPPMDLYGPPPMVPQGPPPAAPYGAPPAPRAGVPDPDLDPHSDPGLEPVEPIRRRSDLAVTGEELYDDAPEVEPGPAEEP